MANYDASIRVSTKVDTSQMQKLQIQIDKATDKVADLSAKYDELKNKKIPTEAYAVLEQRLQNAKFILEAFMEEENRMIAEKKDFGVPWDNLIRKESDAQLKVEAIEKEMQKLVDTGKAFTLGGNRDEIADVGHKLALAQAELRALNTRQEELYAKQMKISAEAERKLNADNEQLIKMLEIAAEEDRLLSIKESATVSDQRIVDLLEEEVQLKTYLNDLEKAGVTAGYAEYDGTVNRLREIKSEVNSYSAGFAKASDASKKFFSTVQKGSKKSSGMLDMLKSKILKMALTVFVINQIRKAFNAMVSAAKEGLKNLAKYSKDYNAAMSALKSECAQLKNGLAAAFEPVANVIVPYITQLVSWLNTAADTMARFLAALSGKSTYTRAKKQVIDYAKAIDSAGKSAKGALAAFDSLNVLASGDTSSGSGAGGELTGADAFETVEIGDSMQSVMDAIQPFKDSIDGWLTNLDFTPAIASFDNLKVACEPFTEDIYDGLLWFLNDVLLPIGTWTIEDAIPKFLDMLAEGLLSLNDIIEKIRPSLEYIWDKVLAPIGEFTGEIFLWAIDEIKDAFSDLADLFVEHGDEINNILGAVGKAMEFLWECVAKPTIKFLQGGIGTLFDYIIKIAGDIIDVFSGIIDFVTGIFTLNWEKAWNGVVDIFKGIINFLIDAYEGVVNTIISGLNMISIDVPDWVPGIGGQKFGFNLEKLSIPRLATGGITNRPTIAQIGEAGREAVLPLENNTEWMDILANKITANMPTGNSGPVYLQVDGKTFARLCLPYLDKEKARIGVNFRTT